MEKMRVSSDPMDPDHYPLDEGDSFESDDQAYPCVCCGCLIGDEVLYGDDWSAGPLCAGCAGLDEEEVPESGNQPKAGGFGPGDGE